MNFRIEQVSLSDALSVITLEGEVDLYAAPAFKAEVDRIVEAGKTLLVCDLSAVTFIDSTALGVLVHAMKLLQPRGGTVSVVCPEPAVAQVFELVGLDRMFQLHADVGEAISALQGAPPGPSKREKAP